MSDIKKKSLSVRISPHLLAALKEAAAKERRTVTNHLVFLVAEDCRRRGISVEAPIQDGGPLRLEFVARLRVAKEELGGTPTSDAK